MNWKLIGNYKVLDELIFYGRLEVWVFTNMEPVLGSLVSLQGAI